MPLFLISGQHLFRGLTQPRCSNVEAVGDMTAARPLVIQRTHHQAVDMQMVVWALGASSHEERPEGKANRMAAGDQKMIKILTS